MTKDYTKYRMKLNWKHLLYLEMKYFIYQDRSWSTALILTSLVLLFENLSYLDIVEWGISKL